MLNLDTSSSAVESMVNGGVMRMSVLNVGCCSIVP